VDDERIKSKFQTYFEHAWSKRCLLSNLAQAQIPEERNEYAEQMGA